MSKFFGLFMAATAFTVVSAAGVKTAQAAVGGPVCNVPVDYATIQAAIDDAGCLTVNVAAGTYTENLTVARPLVLRGSNAGVSALTTRIPEAIITSAAGVTVNVTNGTDVTIDGFTVQGEDGIVASGSTTRTLIQNNIVTGELGALTLDAPGDSARVLNNDLISENRSLEVSTGPYTNLKVNDNRFSGATANPGVLFESAPTNTITGFEFNRNDVRHSVLSAADIRNATVRRNSFNVLAPGSIALGANLHNATVTDNDFDGSDSTSCFQLIGSELGALPSDHVLVARNRFEDCNTFGTQLGQDIEHITITRNRYVSGFDGINTLTTTPPWDVTGNDIRINENNFVGNSNYGINNTVLGVLDATCNWWGDSSGPSTGPVSDAGTTDGTVDPGDGDRVSAGVLFSPWLSAPFEKGDSCDECEEKKNRCDDKGHCDDSPDDGSHRPDDGSNRPDDGHDDDTWRGTDDNKLPGGDFDSDGTNQGKPNGRGDDGGCSMASTSSGDLAGMAPFALMLASRMIRRRRNS